MNDSGTAAAHALVCWQHAAGPYWSYVCAAPFLGRIRPRAPTRVRATDSTITRSIREMIRALPEDAAIAVFIDLPPAQTLPATAELNQLGVIVVPVIQRWVTEPAVLPCAQLLAQLLMFAPHHALPAAARGVVFLLDGDRAGPSDPSFAPAPRRFDNRYDYPICRFPPPTFLQHHGIAAVRWLPTAMVAADLEPYAQQLTEHGLSPRGPALS